jgi:predicted kinase
MCGLAGSGKTTYALRLAEQGYVRLSIDEELWHSSGRYGVDYPAERYGELSEIVERRLHERLITCVQSGANAVVDYSFWKRQDREEYKALVDEHGGRWRLVYLKVPPHELRRRLRLRASRFDADAAFPIDEALFDHYLAVFEEPVDEGEEVVQWDAADTN